MDSNQNTKTKESLTLDYVACLMDSWLQDIYPGAKCASELQISNWPAIEECANSTEGSKLLQEYGVRTQQLNPPLTGIPTVTFEQVSSSEISLNNFTEISIFLRRKIN